MDIAKLIEAAGGTKFTGFVVAGAGAFLCALVVRDATLLGKMLDFTVQLFGIYCGGNVGAQALGVVRDVLQRPNEEPTREPNP